MCVIQNDYYDTLDRIEKEGFWSIYKISSKFSILPSIDSAKPQPDIEPQMFFDEFLLCRFRNSYKNLLNETKSIQLKNTFFHIDPEIGAIRFLNFFFHFFFQMRLLLSWVSLSYEIDLAQCWYVYSWLCMQKMSITFRFLGMNANYNLNVKINNLFFKFIEILYTSTFLC